MKKYGMLMTPPLAQKAHDGDKTVTRRIIPLDIVNMFDEGTDPLMCENADGEPQRAADFARYRRGMIVAVKETHWRWGKWNQYEITKSGHQKQRFQPIYCDSVDHVQFESPGLNVPPNRQSEGYHKRSALYLPFDLARTHVKILDVGPERLQDITEADARAEGAEAWHSKHPQIEILNRPGGSYRNGFHALWDSINAKTFPWASNPWVWRYEFERVEI